MERSQADSFNSDAKHHGNWTRFINHSCRASCDFGAVRLQDNVPRLIVRCIRPLEAFEEITIDYGRGYFEPAHRFCFCGEANCYKPPTGTVPTASENESS